MRVLLIEDNLRLQGVMAVSLESHGFTVDAFPTAGEALEALHTARYAVVILDLGLPDADGMHILKSLPASGAPPVLIVSSRDDTQSVLDGLNGGANDYLRKPFVMDELIARTRVLLRRPGQALGAILKERNVIFDTAQRCVHVDGRPLELSRRELAALERFLRRPGLVVSKRELEDSLYGFNEEVSSNAVEVLVHRLRKKLSAGGAQLDILTLRGIGYMASAKASA